MAENLHIDTALPDEVKYRELLKELDSLLDSGDFIITGMANFTAALKQTFGKISWVGFYLKKEDFLHLGPFQGKIACTRIKIGSGVCGTSAAKMETVIVPDVDQFPGHIACDAASRSEIVVPLVKGGHLYGVLDLDSADYNSFSETDALYLQQLCNLLLNRYDFSTFVIS